MTHKFTTETIHSYVCSKCSVWWSFASSESYTPKEMTCPHCGKRDKTECQLNDNRGIV